jgi:site-specific DNA recombinase
LRRRTKANVPAPSGEEVTNTGGFVLDSVEIESGKQNSKADYIINDTRMQTDPEYRNPETGRKIQKKRPKEHWVSVDLPEIRIVSEEQWEKVQAQIRFVNRHGTPRYGGFSRTQASREYLFSGLLVCGLCGFNITIIGGSQKWAAYGCPAHRYRGVCKNSVTILRTTLERQLLAAISQRVLRPDTLDYTIEHVRKQFESESAKNRDKNNATIANASKIAFELRWLQNQAKNLVSAIAEYGHHKSPTLLSQLNDVEVRIELLSDDLRAPERPEVDISPEQIREFVEKNFSDLESVLTGDRSMAKRILHNHIKRIVLTPKSSSDGSTLFVTGDVDLFSDDNDVLQMVPGGGLEPPRPDKGLRILSPLCLPISPSGPCSYNINVTRSYPSVAGYLRFVPGSVAFPV